MFAGSIVISIPSHDSTMRNASYHVMKTAAAKVYQSRCSLFFVIAVKICRLMGGPIKACEELWG